MRKWPAAIVGACMALAGCSSTPGETSPPPPPATGSTPSPSATASAQSPTPTPTGTPVPDDRLPVSYPISGKLTEGDAGAVVDELHRVAGGLPVLKLDLTEDEATLTALQADRSVISFVWRDGEINRTDSDIHTSSRPPSIRATIPSPRSAGCSAWPTCKACVAGSRCCR